MTAEFLFAFTMVIGAGVLMFALTFALTTVEISQYIVWSAARSYAVGNKLVGDSKTLGETKYRNLTAAFPLLTGNGADSPWFKMGKVEDGDVTVGDISLKMKLKDPALDPENKDPGGEARQPWLGVESTIDLILFKGLQIPFLGKITESPDDFKFPVRAVLLRHPSYQECRDFFTQRFEKGIQQMPAENGDGTQRAKNWKDLGSAGQYAVTEDNGC